MQFKKDQVILVISIFFFLIISYLIIQDFIIPLVFTFLLVYVLFPVYKKVKYYVKYHFLASTIIILSFLILIFSPIVYFFIVFYKSILRVDVELLKVKIITFFQHLNSFIPISFSIEQKVDFFFNYVNELLTAFTFNIPLVLFQIFLIIFFYYYFSKEYVFEILFFRRLFGPKRFSSLRIRFRELINGIVFGQILVRFIQGFIGFIGFLVMGLPYSFLWGILLFLTSFLPVIGTGLVWIPLAYYYFSSGNISIGLSIIGIGILISIIDNVLIPIFISSKVKISPVLILISILGGIQLFGFYGILLGPFSLGALFLLVEELFQDFKDNPRIRKFIWTEEERKKYRSLTTSLAREEYIKLLNQRYEEQSLMSKNQ
jgi:predicted PurR-regulated permease PerM